MLEATDIERQAWGTANIWMEKAVNQIDAMFGDGYAKEHPELVGDFMKTAALDQMGMYVRGVAEVLETFEATLFDGDGK